MNKHHSKEGKAQALSLYAEGYGSETIGRRLGIAPRLIRHWVQQHRHAGALPSIHHHGRAFSPNIKASVVRFVMEKRVSCEQAALHYGISESAVYSWVTRVKTEGYDSLSQIKPRGRPPKHMGRPKKREPQTELEKLRERVSYLETENALLKKVRALVQERIARESGKKPKPSKN